MREKWRLQFVLHRAKLLVAFTLVVVCTCHARALGQNDRISLHVNDAALSDVLRQIEDLSGYMFVYKSGDIEQAGRVTLKAENMAVSAILEKCLEKRFRLIEHACWIFYETNNGFWSDKNFLGDVRIQLTKQLKHALLANRQCSVGDF